MSNRSELRYLPILISWVSYWNSKSSCRANKHWTLKADFQAPSSATVTRRNGRVPRIICQNVGPYRWRYRIWRASNQLTKEISLRRQLLRSWVFNPKLKAWRTKLAVTRKNARACWNEGRRRATLTLMSSVIRRANRIAASDTRTPTWNPSRLCAAPIVVIINRWNPTYQRAKNGTSLHRTVHINREVALRHIRAPPIEGVAPIVLNLIILTWTYRVYHFRRYPNWVSLHARRPHQVPPATVTKEPPRGLSVFLACSIGERAARLAYLTTTRGQDGRPPRRVCPHAAVRSRAGVEVLERPTKIPIPCYDVTTPPRGTFRRWNPSTRFPERVWEEHICEAIPLVHQVCSRFCSAVATFVNVHWWSFLLSFAGLGSEVSDLSDLLNEVHSACESLVSDASCSSLCSSSLSRGSSIGSRHDLLRPISVSSSSDAMLTDNDSDCGEGLSCIFAWSSFLWCMLSASFQIPELTNAFFFFNAGHLSDVEEEIEEEDESVVFRCDRQSPQPDINTKRSSADSAYQSLNEASSSIADLLRSEKHLQDQLRAHAMQDKGGEQSPVSPSETTFSEDAPQITDSCSSNGTYAPIFFLHIDHKCSRCIIIVKITVNDFAWSNLAPSSIRPLY